MNEHDIRINIIRNACDDIEKLTKMCSIDQLSKDISSSIVFWKPIFEEHQYQLPKLIPTTHSAWISFFEKEKILSKSVNRLMEILENPQEDDIDIDCIKVEIPDDFALVFYDHEVSFIEIFADVEGIDYNTLLMMLNNYIMKKLAGVGLNGLTYAEISYRNSFYYLTIGDGRLVTKTTLTREAVKTIFNRVLSHGKIPRDNIFGDNIRLTK